MESMHAHVAAVPAPFEPFVDAKCVAEFTGMQRRMVLDWARAGKLPGHPWGTGQRRIWRFLLSEIAEWGRNRHNELAPGAAKKWSM